ncbi:differentially expressed in FDCP 6-like [Arapaima gigas]
MDLKSELLKSIWYAFTALDVERSGKVSKSQLKVLSHNLYTALNIPHEPVVLEEHFRDDDKGPVSSQGYMPYLNNYILAKAKEGTFDKESFDSLCWMMTSKKNYKEAAKEGMCSAQDRFKLFCLFNLLSEDHYPLVMIPAEVEYLMKKISTAMNQEWDGKLLEDLLSQNPSYQQGLSVWLFLEFVNTGRLLHITSVDTFSLALDEVYQEMYHSVLKKGYMWKKGHVRRNWTERWFVLKPSNISYYVSEDLKEKKGDIPLDKNCVVETLPEKEGRRCLFCVKTPVRAYEISASDQKQKLEWIQAIQTALRLQQEKKTSLHYDLKLRRREQREKSCHNKERVHSTQELQEERERQEQQIESIIQVRGKWGGELEAKRRQEEEQEREHQREVQRELERQLEEAEKARNDMVEELTLKEKEAEQQRQRIQELEIIQQKLETALKAEILAHIEEEKARLEQEQLLQQEEEKVKQLHRLQEEQKALLQRNEPERDTASGQSAIHMASLELQTLRETREKSHLHLEEAQKKLQTATSSVKHWNVQLNRLMKPINPGDQFQQKRQVKKIQVTGDTPFSSQEFISKYQPQTTQESNQAGSQSSSEEEEEELSEQLKASGLSNKDGTETKANGQNC